MPTWAPAGNFSEKQKLETIDGAKVPSEARSVGVRIDYGLERDAIAPPQYKGLGLCPRKSFKF